MHLRRMKMLEHVLGNFYHGHWKPAGRWADLAPEEFHIGSWINYQLQDYDGADCDPPCYTRTGCALGIAMFTREFIAEGFTINTRYNTPEYQLQHGFDAAAAFFRITVGEARYLFNSGSYTGRNDLIAVLKRLSDFIQAEEQRWYRTTPIINRIYRWLHHD